jgi:hypothetical protein
MSAFATFATIEEVGLDILENREESAACLVLDDVPTSTGNRTTVRGLSSARGRSKSEKDCERL